MLQSEDDVVDQRCRDQNSSTDRISKLPDELLISVLYRLTFKESAATSLLSQRWRYLWTIMPNLDFDAKKTSLKVEMAENKKVVTAEERTTTFVRWVDHVIGSHSSCAIEGFRLCFNFTEAYDKYVDKLVKYALSKKVKRLELDLTYTGDRILPHSDDCYTFPYKSLHEYKEGCSNE